MYELKSKGYPLSNCIRVYKQLYTKEHIITYGLTKKEAGINICVVLKRNTKEKTWRKTLLLKT